MQVQHDGWVSEVTPTAVSARGGLLEALADGVCRRSFSSPEAFLYEVTIARALARVVEPQVKDRLRGPIP
jgi:hypothetical protein